MLLLAALALAQPPNSLPLPPAPRFGNRKPPTDEQYEETLIAAAHLFAEKGETDHLHTLLDKHPKWVDQKRKFPQPRKPSFADDHSLLRRAIEGDHRDTVKLLTELKADVKDDCGGGWTPLHLAAGKGNVEVVKLLVDAGADVNASTTALPERRIVPPSGPPNGIETSFIAKAVPAYSVLDVATRSKRDDVAKYLKEKGAKPAEK